MCDAINRDIMKAFQLNWAHKKSKASARSQTVPSAINSYNFNPTADKLFAYQVGGRDLDSELERDRSTMTMKSMKYQECDTIMDNYNPVPPPLPRRVPPVRNIYAEPFETNTSRWVDIPSLFLYLTPLWFWRKSWYCGHEESHCHGNNRNSQFSETQSLPSRKAKAADAVTDSQSEQTRHFHNREIHGTLGGWFRVKRHPTRTCWITDEDKKSQSESDSGHYLWMRPH